MHVDERTAKQFVTLHTVLTALRNRDIEPALA